MCDQPITIETGEMVECRTCNDCINTRKNDWVARAMAEKATTKGETLVINLTYRNNKDGSKPANAKLFHYRDVQLFLKLLRKAYSTEYKATGEIRYIVAGELGSKKGRAHWHMVLFSDRPISTLGEWSDKDQKPQEAMRIGSKIRQHWTLWPHGHVTVDEPGQAGMAYVMKYALKDMFNEVKSRGTTRYTKSENHASGMFRMSKKPPIGQRYLDEKLQEWGSRGVVPLRTEITVPDYKGYWWPRGKFREYLLDGLHEINERVKRNAGRDAPQWSTLLASVSQMEKIKDWEALSYGEQIYSTQEIEVEKWKKQLRPQQDAIAAGQERPGTRKRCSGVLVCRACWNGKTKEGKAEYTRWVISVKTAIGPGKSAADVWVERTHGRNPFCAEREENWRPGIA